MHHSKESFQINDKCNNKGLTEEIISKVKYLLSFSEKDHWYLGHICTAQICCHWRERNSNNTLLVTCLRKLH